MSNSKSRPEKRRRRSIIAFEMIRLDRTATEPLHEQLYRQVRDELKSGRFSDGSSRLPSSRALAANRGISRSTVRLAFSKLHAEGYLRSEPGSGTFVANLLPETFLTADQPQNLPINPAPNSHLRSRESNSGWTRRKSVRPRGNGLGSRRLSGAEHSCSR